MKLHRSMSLIMASGIILSFSGLAASSVSAAADLCHQAEGQIQQALRYAE